MYSVIVHYGELALKGRNRPWFVSMLVRNPKTMTPTAVKLLEKLPMAEIRKLAKSNDVPRAVSIAARKKAVDA